MPVIILEANREKALESWTEVITPKTNLLDLRLGEVWKYRDLLWLFVKRDFVSQYKQTIFGPIWHIIQPLFTTIIFLFLFGRIANIPTDGIEPILFYMSGISIWNYFSVCLTSTSNTFLTNANIFGKVYFPRLVLPLSIIISNMVRFGIQFCLLLIMMIWYLFKGSAVLIRSISGIIIVTPIVLIIMAGLGLGFGLILSALTTKYRDLSFSNLFRVYSLGMYATPVILSYFLRYILKFISLYNFSNPYDIF